MANAARESESSNALKNCVNDLQKAVNIISELTNRPSSSNSQIEQPVVPKVSQTLSMFQEHKKLFSPYQQYQGQGQQVQVDQSNENKFIKRFEPPKIGNSNNKKRKRGTSNENKGQGNRRYIWSHRFVCLSDSEDCQTPNLDYKIVLKNAGLGEAEIAFQKDGNAEHFHQKLLETFPKLKDCGGYEVLRTAERSSHKLVVIPCPREGYSISVLKECLNQAKGYIRPVQSDLSLEPSEASCVMASKTV